MNTSAAHPRVRIYSPTGLLATIPHLLGFTPENSLVVVGVTAASTLSPPRSRLARQRGTGPSSRRSSLGPAKITVKGGASGALTRDSLRSPLTLNMPGTIRRLSGGWPGVNDQQGGPG